MDNNNNFDNNNQQTPNQVPSQNGNPQQYQQPPQYNQQYQQPPQYNQQQYQQPPVPVEKPKPTGAAIAGLVLGVLSVLMFFIGLATFWTTLAGVIMSIIGIVLCALDFKKGKNGMNIAGLIMSIIALVLNVIIFCACGLVIIAAMTASGL